MGMVLRYVLWQGYLPECAGIFFKKDRVIVDRTKPSRDHLRQSLTKLDKKVLSRLETLGQKMFSCKDRYVVPDLQTYFFILLLILIFALFFPVGQAYLKQINSPCIQWHMSVAGLVFFGFFLFFIPLVQKKWWFIQ